MEISTAPVDGILSPAGRKLIENALQEGSISLGKVASALSREAARNMAPSLVKLVGFLQENNIETGPGTAALLPASRPPQHAEYDDLSKTPRKHRTSAYDRELVLVEREPSTSEIVVDNGIENQSVRFRPRYDDDWAMRLYLAEIGPAAPLSVEDETELVDRIKQGDEVAREHIIKANLHLVVEFAQDYEGFGLPLLDLINEGNLGLMKAVEAFSPVKGRLSTYVSWMINQSIKRAIANQAKTIRLPVHLVDILDWIRCVILKLGEELGHEPTDEEIAEKVGLEPERVTLIRRSEIQPVSLDAPMENDNSNTWSEMLVDENVPTPDGQFNEKDYIERILEVLKTLSPQQQTILTLRCGLEDGNEQTLEQIGQKYGVTRERIRQIEFKALKLLRRRIGKMEVK